MKHMCVTDGHDMTSAVKVALNPNTTNKLNSLPNDTILDLSNVKDFADNIMNMTFCNEFIMERVENIVGKGENAGYQHSLLFFQCFEKASLSGLLKVYFQFFSHINHILLPANWKIKFYLG